MRRSLLLLVCLLLGSSLASHADTTTFRVSSYVPDTFTDLLWQVNGGFAFDGSHNSTDDKGLIPGTRQKSETSSARREFDLGSRFARRFYSVPRFLYLAGSVNGIVDRNRYTSTTESYDALLTMSRFSRYYDEDKHRYDRYEIDLSGEAGEYLTGDWYLAHSAGAELSYYNRNDYESINERLRIDTAVTQVVFDYRLGRGERPGYDRTRQVRLATGLGYGRVYEGQYAAQALEMVRLLEKSGLLFTPLSYEQLQGLAATIYHYRQISPFDDRTLRIEAIQEIADYLARRGGIDPAVLAAVPLVEDVWDYFQRDTRRFGWQVEAELGFEYRDQTQDVTSTSSTRYLVIETDFSLPGSPDTVTNGISRSHSQDYAREQRREIFLQATGRYYRPLSLRWQFDCEMLFRFSLLSAFDRTTRRVSFLSGLYEVTHYEDESNSWKEWHLLPSLRYIFDKRTSLVLDGEVSYQDVARLVGIDRISRYNRAGWYEAVGLTGIYRVSLPTSLSLLLSANRWDLDPDDGDDQAQWSYSVRGTATHYLF